MKRTTLFVDEALESDLRALAKRQGRPVASLVREAVAQYVAAQTHGERRLPRFVGLGRSGSRDTAERHEEILFQEVDSPAARPAPTAARPAAPRRARGRRRATRRT